MRAGVLINVLFINPLTTGSFSCSTPTQFETDRLVGQKNIE